MSTAVPATSPSATPVLAAATHDEFWRSPLPPFVRAHRFVERVALLSQPEWREVVRRAHAVDPALRAAGLRALTDRLVGHPQARAFGALTRAAHDAAEIAARRGVVAEDAVGRAAGLASLAASALAMRDELATPHGLVHYVPFSAALDIVGAV
ncbi:MAG: hypothetical protein ACXWZS_00260 [Gemmatirosa sp.]